MKSESYKKGYALGQKIGRRLQRRSWLSRKVDVIEMWLRSNPIKTLAIVVVLAFMVAVFGLVGLANAGSGNLATSGSESAAGASAVIDSHDNNTVNDRSFAPGGVNVTAQTHPLFTREKGSDVSFRPFHEFIQFYQVFSEGALEGIAAGGDVEFNFTPMTNFLKAPLVQANGNRYIWIVSTVPDDFKAVGPFDARADDEDTNSFQLIARMALEAMDNGDNVLVVQFEGYNDKVYAAGWGIGTHVVTGTVNESGKASTVGGGGFGISKNNVGNESLPWIRGYSGCVPVEIGPVAGTYEIVPNTVSSDNRNQEGGR